MNPHEGSLPALDPQTLDLLVDGELPEAERRRLLDGLDGIPGGWRACALAFLEGQCWREQVRAAVRGTPVTERAGAASAASGAEQPPVPVSRRQARPRRVWRLGGTVLAMAASFLLAFVLANSLRSPREVAGTPGEGQLAETFAGGPEAGALVEPGGASGPGEAGTKALPSRSPEGLSPPWHMVTVTLPGDQQGAKRTIRLPAVEADRIDDSWFGPDSETMPAEVRAALEQSGYRVRGFHRQLVPLPTDDGRRLVVPVDQVELHYVGNPSYQ